jgi:Uma2 family endonuclease
MAIELDRYRFTVDEYDRMAEAGIFDEDSRVELLDGVIVKMAAIGNRHGGVVKWLLHWFEQNLAGRAVVSVQDPVRLSRYSEPQPDLALLRPRADFYRTAHPMPADTFLVVEVADTTLQTDRTTKLPLYAKDGIPEVWIVNLPDGLIEIYRRPGPGGYQEIRLARPGETVAPEAFPDLQVLVADIIG